MNHQDLINTCVFEQIQGLLFSDLSGPLRYTCFVNKKVIQARALEISCRMKMLQSKLKNSQKVRRPTTYICC